MDEQNSSEDLVRDLRSHARLLLRHRTAADELIRETLSNSKDAVPRYEIFRSLHRKLRANPVTEEDTGPDYGFSVPKEEEAAIDLHALRNDFNNLPEEYKAVYLLIVVEGFSYEETAGILDVDSDTVQERLTEARHKLAEGMPELGPDVFRKQGDGMRAIARSYTREPLPEDFSRGQNLE